jgi:macrodomain Ter protein organizer (MatP/YcbG family)
MNNDTNGFTSFDNLPGMDPAVESLLGQGKRRQDEARLPRNERSRKKKERERAEKRKPNRINLDLPVDLKKRLEHLAKKEGVPISQLVAYLLYEPVKQLESREISLWGYKTASGCPKFECNLDLKRRSEEVSQNLSRK